MNKTSIKSGGGAITSLSPLITGVPQHFVWQKNGITISSMHRGYGWDWFRWETVFFSHTPTHHRRPFSVPNVSHLPKEEPVRI